MRYFTSKSGLFSWHLSLGFAFQGNAASDRHFAFHSFVQSFWTLSRALPSVSNRPEGSMTGSCAARRDHCIRGWLSVADPRVVHRQGMESAMIHRPRLREGKRSWRWNGCDFNLGEKRRIVVFVAPAIVDGHERRRRGRAIRRPWQTPPSP